MAIDVKMPHNYRRNYRRAGGQPGDRTAILYGPQGSGKSEQLCEQLRQALDCTCVQDEWWPGDRLVKHALHVTHAPVAEVRTAAPNALLLSVDEARALLSQAGAQ